MTCTSRVGLFFVSIISLWTIPFHSFAHRFYFYNLRFFVILMFKQLIILIFFFLVSTHSHASIVAYFLHPKEIHPYRLDLTQNRLEKLNPNGQWEFVHDIAIDPSNPLELLDESFFYYLPSEKASVLYFFQHCTNKVFTLDLTTFQFKRIDRTYYRGDNCYAYRFLAHNTIYSLGGYGFWRSNNHLIHFEKKSDEWEGVNTFGAPSKGIFRGFSGYIPEREEIISFSNYYHNVAEDFGKFVLDQGIYKFSFANKTWTKIDEVSLEPVKSMLANLEQIQRQDIYFSGTYFVIQFTEQNGVRCFYFINARTLAVSKFEDASMEFARFSLVNVDEGSRQVYRSGKYIVNYFAHANLSPEKRILKVNMDELAKRAVFIGYLADKPWYMSLWFRGFLILTILAGAIRLWLSRRIFLQAPKPVKKEVAFSPEVLDDQSKQLINILLNHVDQEGIDVIAITDLLGLSLLSPDAQRYKRSALIKELNGKLALITHSSQTIQRIDSSLDRRQKRYILDPTTIDILKKIK